MGITIPHVLMNDRPFFGWSTPEAPASLQDQGELAKFIDLLNSRNVRTYLEVGARYGGTFERVMECLPAGSIGVAIDFPGGSWGDQNSIEHLIAVLRRLRDRGYNVRAVFGPSSAPEVIKLVKRDRDHFDAILIDGDHSYAAIKRDYEIYGRMGTIVALHDIVAPEGFANRAGQVVEVPRLWNEIKAIRKHKEITSTGSVMGIGVIFNERDWRCPL